MNDDNENNYEYGNSNEYNNVIMTILMKACIEIIANSILP